MFPKTILIALVLVKCYMNEEILNNVGVIPKAYNIERTPNYYDWRKLNMVSSVKDQGTCNVCWAFSIVANIESHLKIYTNKEEVLSEQFLVDCIPNRGCNADQNILKTFSYIISELGGILRQRDYYRYDQQKHDCRWQSSTLRNEVPESYNRKDIIQGRSFYNYSDYKKKLKYSRASLVPVVGFRRVERDENVMADFVYQYGPLIAGINSQSMRKYSNGIDEPTDEECDPSYRDHYVLIVGYSAYVEPDTKKVTPYWIIKNSWGKEWGDGVFYYLRRGRNACGIANEVAFGYVN